jgi:indole-3-glycerol phosphate synthase
MTDILEQITADKRVEIARAKQQTPIEALRERIVDAPDTRNFFAAVTRPTNQLRVIAEVKRASPSAGVIREPFDPVGLARAYAENGAAAVSCLTDRKYFRGSLEDLTQIKQAVDLPVLRKDFIIDRDQLYEARLAGADAVLLIAECLEEAELIDLLILATELHLTTLVEVHDADSLLRVKPHIGFPHPSYTLLGINNRNLRSMQTDVAHTLRMLAMIEDLGIVVSESGIREHDDVRRLQLAGVHRILVGEHLMRQPDVGLALRRLMFGSPAA